MLRLTISDDKGPKEVQWELGFTYFCTSGKMTLFDRGTGNNKPKVGNEKHVDILHSIHDIAQAK